MWLFWGQKMVLSRAQCFDLANRVADPPWVCGTLLMQGINTQLIHTQRFTTHGAFTKERPDFL